MREAWILLLVASPGILILAYTLCQAGRIPAAAEERNCGCDGCKILRARQIPKDKSLRDRLAGLYAQEMEEARHA